MNRTITIVSFLIMLAVAGGCGNSKALNERLSLWRNDKIPYGTFYAFQQLDKLFPEAEILATRESPENKLVYLNKQERAFKEKLEEHSGNTGRLFIVPRIQPTTEELDGLLQFVYEGNQVFLSAFEFGENLLDSFDLEVKSERFISDSSRLSILNPESLTEESFSYPGVGTLAYFSALDSGYTTVLGWNSKGKPNLIKIAYDNGGAIYLHLAPLAFTNFFLLHKENNRYYDYVLSQLPEDLELLVWDDYFRTHSSSEDEGKQSGMKKTFPWMLKQPPLAIALWLLLLLFVLVLVFESKRKQKAIPVIEPLRNTTLEFVKTIGRLYYQRRDNKNLSDKMTAHFLDMVRQRYNIPTTGMDTTFENRLAYISGLPPAQISQLVATAKTLGNQTTVSDTALMEYNDQLQQFYKQA